jgi:hypothetical protein
VKGRVFSVEATKKALNFNPGLFDIKNGKIISLKIN